VLQPDSNLIVCLASQNVRFQNFLFTVGIAGLRKNFHALKFLMTLIFSIAINSLTHWCVHCRCNFTARVKTDQNCSLANVHTASTDSLAEKFLTVSCSRLSCILCSITGRLLYLHNRTVTAKNGFGDNLVVRKVVLRHRLNTSPDTRLT